MTPFPNILSIRQVTFFVDSIFIKLRYKYNIRINQKSYRSIFKTLLSNWMLCKLISIQLWAIVSNILRASLIFLSNILSGQMSRTFELINLNEGRADRSEWRLYDDAFPTNVFFIMVPIFYAIRQEKWWVPPVDVFDTVIAFKRYIGEFEKREGDMVNLMIHK